jgi:hypothetical protein
MPFYKPGSAAYQANRRKKMREGTWKSSAEPTDIPEILEKYADIDATGIRFRSEAKSFQELQRLFYGIIIDDSDDENKKIKKTSVNPSQVNFLGKVLNFDQWLENRDRARKDLFWLGKDVLKHDLVESTHKIVCDLFVNKNFDNAFPEGYTVGDVHKAINRQQRKDRQGRDTKEMMLIDPRGFFKSTINRIDCAQWLLNVPDIRILILTGEYKLAVAFMRQIKSYFYLPEGGRPTDFHVLFPEYILTGVDGTSREPLECPARNLRNQVEASLWVNSIDANLSGWHCDIRKGDDIVTDENCNSDSSRESLKDKFDGTANLLDEWGFSDYIGTRYFTDDWYAKRIEIAEEVPILYHCRACWDVKPQYSQVPLRDLTKDMVVLTFPEKANFASLRRKLLENERSFRNQQLNQPSDSDEDSSFKIAFEEAILRAHVYQRTAVPKEGEIFVTWDWSPSSNKQSDLSVGVAHKITKKEALMDDGTKEVQYGVSVLEIIFDKWKPTELARQVVMFNKKWNPKQTLIEKSLGAELLQMEMQRQAFLLGTSLNVYWKPVSSQPDAKRNRIKGLETLLANDRLWFVAGPWLDETFYQFVRYTGERKNRGRKDDIPDAISFVGFFLPSTVMNEDLTKLNEAMQKVQMLKDNYNRIFGTGPMVPSLPVSETPVRPERGRFGIPGLRIA